MTFTISAAGGETVSIELESGFDARLTFELWASLCKQKKTNQAPFLEDLRRLAAGKRIVEFGYSEGQSAFTFLCGRPRWVYSFDILPSEKVKNLDVMHFVAGELNCGFNFTQANTAELPSIPECDVLLIDSLHTYAHVMAELKHATSVKETIIFHDTTDAEIMKAVNDFAYLHHSEWKLEGVRPEGAGIAYLKRAAMLSG